MRLARIVQAAAQGALRLPGKRVRWKIMLPYTVLSLLVAVAGTYFVTGYLTRSLSDRFANQLAEAGRVTADAVVRREQDHLEIVRATQCVTTSNGA